MYAFQALHVSILRTREEFKTLVRVSGARHLPYSGCSCFGLGYPHGGDGDSITAIVVCPELVIYVADRFRVRHEMRWSARV